MAKNNWKRLIIYERTLSIFLLIGMLFDPTNKKLLNSIIPKEITDYMFWLGLGLYAGFHLCAHEYKRGLRLHRLGMINTKNKNHVKLTFWNMYSSCAIAGGGVALTALLFFRSYLAGCILYVVLSGVFAVLLLIVSELMEYQYILEHKITIDKYWSRFIYSEKVLIILLIGLPFFDIVNRELLNSAIPDEIEIYLFWLNSGLYLGFMLCKHEYYRAVQLNYQQQLKDEVGN